MQIPAVFKGIFIIFAAYFLAVLHILKTRQKLTHFMRELRLGPASVGLVPTMGALHEGHLSLIARSVAENDLTVCSIFVNPTQFDNNTDLERYPRPVESDIAKLSESGCDVLFLPSVEEMYPNEEKWQIDLGDLESILEGKFRPGHYQGVTQIVKKLFDLVGPRRAYFGQKDYQQLLVIGEMVRLLSIPVELVRCPTRREGDGLAMSSRNIHLSSVERREAALLPKALFLIKELSARLSPAEARGKALELLAASELIKVEYLVVANAATLSTAGSWDEPDGVLALAAIKIGQTRLIDNLFIRQKE